MKKVLLAVGVLAFSLMVVMASAESATVNGYVSDTQCGAKGASTTHAACMTKCLGKGAKVAIVTDSDQKVLTVDNPEVLKGHEGHHIAATGTVTGETIHVDSVKML
ncbi:MAG: hypothetical protein ABSE92_09935 [Terriglobales bacterium]|jgi:hypothetical protein